MTKLPPNPFIFTPQIDRDILDLTLLAAVQKAVEQDEPEDLPAFLSSPRPEYLTAADMRPICEIIVGHASRASH